MTIHKRHNRYKGFGTRAVILTVLLCACNRDLSDDPIPLIPFPDLVVNLNLPEYTSLKTDGGYKQVNSIGVRGVIIYRKSVDTYLAYEVNCSFHPNEAASNISVHVSGLYLTCTGCASNFDWTNGAPTGGVAWRPLRKYRTELSAFNLTITDEIVN